MRPPAERLNPARQRIYAAALRLFAEKGATQIGVSELAAAAGVARGTIYNNLNDADVLFEEVARQLIDEMTERLMQCFAGMEDPAVRMAIGVRHYVRRTHEEPDWARFITRFAFSNRAMQGLWLAGPGENLGQGLAAGRYRVAESQLRIVLGMVTGGVITAMATVLDGEAVWRKAGSDCAELVLVALGIEPDEARQLASMELPPLPALA
ncbi:TetR/AcrR family transcriptional regulator [Duganella sp. FT3S]|uniref:TetR/AcrR family transcriptional regulator n=1 Tax=Rugamonas fusca TaxID=2758568 RepID=A0A7W2EHR6_9BURK|nr:TetR/AcrR family transcriptional regulator [Rugamonas fusca]MBA5606059.1 TetR/AcrR family transcriptional regulator [Rugamonas fusca]